MRRKNRNIQPAHRKFALDTWFPGDRDHLVVPQLPTSERFGRWLGPRLAILGAVTLTAALIDVAVNDAQEVKPVVHWIGEQLGSTGLLPPPPAS
jgi:hypothetical protein